MKIGDTIAIPGYGEYKLALGPSRCSDCAAENDMDLCYALPVSYCSRPQPDVNNWYNLIFIKVEK